MAEVTAAVHWGDIKVLAPYLLLSCFAAKIAPYHGQPIRKYSINFIIVLLSYALFRRLWEYIYCRLIYQFVSASSQILHMYILSFRYIVSCVRICVLKLYCIGLLLFQQGLVTLHWAFTRCHALLGHRQLHHSINERSLCRTLQLQVSVLAISCRQYIHICFPQVPFCLCLHVQSYLH